jgi:hypothetical protein
MKSVTFPNGPIKMAGNLHLPKDFSKDRSYLARARPTSLCTTRPNSSRRPWPSSCRFTKTQARLRRRATSSGR